MAILIASKIAYDKLKSYNQSFYQKQLACNKFQDS